MKLLGVLFLAVVVVGCSAKKSENTETTQAQTTYGRTVEKAKEVAATLSNPKPGIDPVCGMAIDESAAVIVAIAEKNYGVCSEDCATKLRAEPEKYVHVEASH
jgi:YHS domain-containing protein